MSTILTDDELRQLWQWEEPFDEFKGKARAVEAAVLAKLAQQEPVAMRYDFDGYGYKYIDSGSGSDWRSRIPDAEAVYAAPLPASPQADRQRVPQGWIALSDRRPEPEVYVLAWDGKKVSIDWWGSLPKPRGTEYTHWMPFPKPPGAGDRSMYGMHSLAAAPEAPAQASAVDERAIDAAARKIAECMDYPWEHMPEKGRSTMRDHAKAVLDAARAALAQKGAA